MAKNKNQADVTSVEDEFLVEVDEEEMDEAEESASEDSDQIPGKESGGLIQEGPELTVIIYNDMPEKLEELKEKLRQEESGAQNQMEILVVGGGEEEEASAYREGYHKALGRYVSFIHSSGSYSNGIVRSFLDRYEKNGLIFCVRPAYLDTKNKLNFYLPNGDRGLRELDRSPHFINLILPSFFIPREILDDSFFTTGLTREAGLYGLIELLEKKKAYYYLEKGRYVLTNGIFNGYNYAEQYDKNWYTRTLKNELEPLLDKYPDSLFVQHSVYFLIVNRFMCNWNTRDDGLLNEEETQEFLDTVRNLLQKIDDDIILEGAPFGTETMQKNMRYHLLGYKYPGGERQVTEHKYLRNSHIMAIRKVIVGNKNDIKAYLYNINYEKRELVFDGRLSFGYCLDPSKLKVYFRVNGENIDAEPNQIYSLNKYFGVPMDRAYTFTVHIPEEKFAEGAVIRVYYEHEGHSFAIPFVFGKIQSRINTNYGQSYWKFGNWIMTCPRKDKSHLIHVRVADKKAHRKAEKALLKAYVKSFLKKKNKRALKAAVLRLAYWATRKKYSNGKHVWLTFDQLFKGGDNGEYFFKYVADHRDRTDIEPYYIINKTAVEYADLKKKYGKRIIVFNSFRCKLMALQAEMIFATRADAYQYCGIASALEKYVRDLCNARVVCLQHGLTIQRIAQYQNRLFDNTRAYFLVSPLEKKNIMHPAYGYEEEQMYMTGAPRYDGLMSRDKRQILITPTWRRSVTAGTNTRGQMHEYSVNFKHTEYFKIYDRLINDEKLIRTAEKTGYKLIYLIHPILSPQIKDFGKNDRVEIIPGSEVNYETILSESSLMLTDYSGIQFDFAYMRKPVVYYHPDTLPPQYDSNVYDYDTEALGPVCRTHEQIVDSLCRYMENECRMEEEYENRVNRFYAYNDHENSRRVYEAGLAFMEKMEKEELKRFS